MENNYIKLGSPLKVTFNITNKCNFKCYHCYNDSSDNCLQKELSLKKVISILRELKKNRVPLISINGGDPFLRKDIIKILSKAKELGFILNVNTNGSLITNKIASELSRLKVKNIDVSMPAYNRESFKEFTSVDSFNSVINGIQNLIENKIYPHIALPITKKNLGWGPSIVRLVNKLGLNSIHTIVLVEKGRATENELAFDLEELKSEYEDLLKSSKKYKINISLDSPFNLGESMISTTNNIDLDRGCLGGRYIACIQSNGDVTPCALFPDYVVGNLNKKSFSSIWNSNDMCILGSSKFKMPEECLHCKKISDCYGGCPAVYLNNLNNYKKYKPCI